MFYASNINNFNAILSMSKDYSVLFFNTIIKTFEYQLLYLLKQFFE
jgi:hypothetical protein